MPRSIQCAGQLRCFASHLRRKPNAIRTPRIQSTYLFGLHVRPELGNFRSKVSYRLRGIVFKLLRSLVLLDGLWTLYKMGS